DSRTRLPHDHGAHADVQFAHLARATAGRRPLRRRRPSRHLQLTRIDPYSIQNHQPEGHALRAESPNRSPFPPDRVAVRLALSRKTHSIPSPTPHGSAHDNRRRTSRGRPPRRHVARLLARGMATLSTTKI